MSVQLNLSTHGAELKAAYKEVVDKACPTNWILLGYTKGSNELKVDGKGDGGLEELSEEFEDDKVLFALAQVIDPNSQLPKLVFISWCGEGAPVQRKGLLPSHLGHVQKFFEGYHVQINARDAEDVTPEQIMKKVDEGSGAKYSYHEQVRSQTPATQSPKPAVAQIPSPVHSFKKTTQPPSPVSKPESPRTPTFKAPQASNSLQSRFLQQVDQGDKEKEAREEQERFEREFLQKSQAKAAQSPRNSGVSSRVQEARDREERELQERLEKARISRSGFSPGKQTLHRELESKESSVALENAKRLEEERRREAEIEEQREADRLQEHQRAEEAARLREREQHRLAQEKEERSRQEALEREQQQREREARRREQLELEARREQEAEEARQKQQREREELELRQREQEQQEREARQAQEEEEELRTSHAREAEESSATAEPASNLTAIALFDYAAIDETEVNLKEGELVTSIQQVDEGWWQGVNEAGEAGLFPANYVELVAPPEPSLSQEPSATHTSEAPKSQNHAIALYDYEASEQGELSFGAAEKITSIDFLSDDWWQGTNSAGQSGLFPANYVDLQ